MKEQVFKSKWNQMQGKIKQQWGKLTDDDLSRIQGDSEMLLGKLQEKYGKKKEELREELDDFLTKLEEK